MESYSSAQSGTEKMPTIRLSLKDVFGLIAFCAVVAWCLERVGVGNGIFWMAVCVSALMSGSFIYLAKHEQRRRFAPFVIAPCFLFCLLPLASLSLLTNGILLFAAGVVCACRPPFKVRTLSTVALVCAAVALIVGALPGIHATRELAALRSEFPIESLADRLRYEQRIRDVVNAPSRKLTETVSLGLAELESQLNRGHYRQMQLRQLHSRQYELFVRANGFGVGRMVRPTRYALELPVLRDLPFAEDGRRKLDAEFDDLASRWPVDFVGASDDLDSLHEVNRNGFADPMSWGAVLEPIVQVAGFEQHGFRAPAVRGVEDREAWEIERLELVSLLKFDEPRVYVLDHLPRMDQLAGDEVATRPLDEFEADSLEKLWADVDVVVVEAGDHLRMLGSLRAAKQCLDCHSVQRGELLGAFSYVLVAGALAEGESIERPNAVVETVDVASLP